MTKTSLTFQDKKTGYFIGFIITLALTLLKSAQYLTFQTTAYDLGIQASVAWNTAHGNLFYDSIQKLNYLGDHFSPIYLFISVFYRFWESPLFLLLLQNVAIGLAATALYWIGSLLLEKKSLVLLVTFLFIFNSYLHRISLFDFHPVVFAIPIFLWILYFVETGKKWPIVALTLLACTIEETLLPPLAGIGLYLLFFRKNFRTLGLFIFLFSLIFFILEVKFWMPYFLGENRLTHIGRYSNLGGNSLGEVLNAVLHNPLIPFRELVTPGWKIYSLFLVFASVCFLPLLARKELFLMGIPALLLMISCYPPQWQFTHQYSALFLSFLFFAALYGLKKIEGRKDLFLSKMFNWADSSKIKKIIFLVFFSLIGWPIFHFSSYMGNFSVAQTQAIYQLIKAIPEMASVCATSNFVPQLSNRLNISVFTKECRADYLLLISKTENFNGTFSPGTKEEYELTLEEIKNSADYFLLKESEGILLFKKNKSDQLND